MLRCGSALSLDPDPARAAREVAERALAQAGASRADAALVFATYPTDREHALLGPVLMDVLGTRAVVGTRAQGVLAGGLEAEDRPAVSALVLAGVDAEPFLLADLAGAEDAAGLEIEGRLEGSASENDLVVALGDPLAFDTSRLLAGLSETLQPATLVGAGASLGTESSGVQWCGRELVTGGLGGLVLRGPWPPAVVVAQGCRPITPPLVVTRVDGNWVLELDGRPALEVYREVAREPLAEDLRRAADRLLVAVGGASDRADDFAVSGVAGFAPDRGAIALPHALRAGARVRLALRDADLAREDLKHALELAGAERARPACGLYLSCAGRGRGLFGHAGLETAYVDQALSPAPLAGMFGTFQIGPIGGHARIHTYAGVLAMLG